MCEFKPPVSVAADTVPLEAGETEAANVNVLPVLPRTSYTMVSAVAVPVYVASATPATTLAFSTTASAVMVAARLAPILTWLPTAPEATKVKAVPLIVTVLLTAGCVEKVIAPVDATVPAVVGAPKAAFSQKPKPAASIGTSTSPSVVIASSNGARGSRP